MQALAAILVFAYYRYPALQDATTSLQRLKASGGAAFDVISGAISGGVLPQAAKIVTFKVKRLDRAFISDTLFNAFVYGIVGVQVDYFYRLQGALFGNEINLTTLLEKNAVDMILFSPFLCIPTAIILYEWRKSRSSGHPLVNTFRTGFYRTKIVPILIPCWSYWVPMLFCVYAMPQNLQFPLSQLAEASWCLLVIFIATDEGIGEGKLA